jgi:hypothetical protein
MPPQTVFYEAAAQLIALMVVVVIVEANWLKRTPYRPVDRLLMASVITAMLVFREVCCLQALAYGPSMSTATGVLSAMGLGGTGLLVGPIYSALADTAANSEWSKRKKATITALVSIVASSPALCGAVATVGMHLMW